MNSAFGSFSEEHEVAFKEAMWKKMGFRKVGNATVHGKRTPIYCTPDGGYCQTKWGEPYDWSEQ